MESKILNKYVTIYPSVSRLFSLSRVQVLYVVSETAKQIKAKESPDSRYTQTIPKSNIGRVVSEDEVKRIRTDAMNINNEYRDKRMALVDQYLEKSNSLV